MSNLLVTYYIFFGLMTIMGGVMGFVKAKSRASLIAGTVSGLLLLAAAHFLVKGPHALGQLLGLGVSAALAGRFVPAYMRTKVWMPGGMMSVLSMLGVVLGLLAFAM